MAKKNDFVKRAEGLLHDRLAVIADVGELLEKRTEQQAALADTQASIDKAVQSCLEAGWSPVELKNLGIDTPRRPNTRTRRTTSAVLETHTGTEADGYTSTGPIAGAGG